VFVGLDDNETIVEQSARVRGILALMSSISGSKRIGFVYQDLSAVINTRRFVVLKTRPPGLTRYKFVGQPLRLEE